ncbi:high mobility group protein B2 [Lynx canadensis]|uniref:high mobility group protein B2 n=1 Tax=Lynx canadensis TaxID=61383 RepID=UPI0011B05027|nr:high mobility group protein B2 [Lynx canadensis]
MTNRRPLWRGGGACEGLNNHQNQSERRGCGLWPGSSSYRGAENSAKQEAEDCVSDKPVHAGALGRKRLCWIRLLRGTLRKSYHQVDAVCHHGQRRPQQAAGQDVLVRLLRADLREEHKKKHPDSSVNFAEFSKKCSERWKTMSAKEKSKFEDMAKSDKARYDREMKNYVPPKGDKKGKKKDPNAPKRPPSAFSCFVLNIAQRSKVNTLVIHWGYCKKVG